MIPHRIFACIEFDDLFRAVKLYADDVFAGCGNGSGVAVYDAKLRVVFAEDESVADSKSTRSNRTGGAVNFTPVPLTSPSD
jgi:hypothetical protein